MKVKDKKLIFNAVQCAKCDDVVVSSHRHDFRYCKCGAIAVDGGLEYTKRCGDIFNCIDLSKYEEYEREEYYWETEIRELRESVLAHDFAPKPWQVKAS